jgi:ADP-ribose pyrophosphatase
MEIERPKSKQPMPSNAHKVFEGVIFDVYQWEQKLYDGTISKFEKLKRLDTVVVFPILDDGRILLTYQEQPGKKPFIGATGGGIFLNEDILSAARRELLEETGYEAKEYTLWKSIQPLSKIEWAVYIFVAHGLSKVSDVSLDAGEKIKIMPVDFDEFINITLKPDFAEQEIYRDIVETLFDEDKRRDLKQLLSPKQS